MSVIKTKTIKGARPSCLYLKKNNIVLIFLFVFIFCPKPLSANKNVETSIQRATSFPLRENRFLLPSQIQQKKAPQQLFPKTFKAKIVGIPDANTVMMLIQKTPMRLRLAHIDAPDRNQYFGNEAQQILSDKLFMKEAFVHHNHKTLSTDAPINLYLNQENINLWLIKTGLAWCEESSKNQSCLKEQGLAKAQKKGLWQQALPTPPWNYRETIAKNKLKNQLSPKKDWRKNDFYMKMIKTGGQSADYKTNSFIKKQAPYTKPIPKLPKAKKRY